MPPTHVFFAVTGLAYLTAGGVYGHTFPSMAALRAFILGYTPYFPNGKSRAVAGRVAMMALVFLWVWVKK